MKKDSVIVPVLLLALALFGGCDRSSSSGGKGEQLILYTWAEMFPQDILDSFEQDTGIAVNYVNFDTDETMLTKLQTANGGDYDLIVADDYIIETAIAEGLVQRLDKSKLSNYGNINPLYQKPFYDPRDEYTVPYGAGVMTLVYDPARVSKQIQGYGDLWDPSLRGNVGTIGNYRVVNGIALKVMGQSYNTNDIGVIRDAGELLLELAPNIRLIRDDLLQDDLLAGEVAVAVMYTSQVTAAKLANPALEVAFPAEGIGFGIMGAFIPSKAPNPGAAHTFLDYILDPERGAACFEFLGYYSTFSASDPHIDEEYQSFLTLPEGFNVNMEMIQNVSAEAEEEHERIWTAFRERAGQSRFGTGISPVQIRIARL
jgi:spermidine/putrescine-binding protein